MGPTPARLAGTQVPTALTPIQRPQAAAAGAAGSRPMACLLHHSSRQRRAGRRRPPRPRQGVATAAPTGAARRGAPLCGPTSSSTSRAQGGRWALAAGTEQRGATHAAPAARQTASQLCAPGTWGGAATPATRLARACCVSHGAAQPHPFASPERRAVATGAGGVGRRALARAAGRAPRPMTATSSCRWSGVCYCVCVCVCC